MEITHEKTKEILEVFNEISQVPRPSKKEEKICAWMVRWAKDNGFESKQDEAGNIVVMVPGTNGLEEKPTVVIQTHLDMVCEKMPEVEHDFDKDPIKLVYDGEWLKADGTTLGSDNGMGVAMSLVLAKDPNLTHPPLELLFTVDEETGLTGAEALSSDFISGRILLNLDTEDDGVFTIGSAGGADSVFEFNIEREALKEGNTVYELTAGGMKGGHSGAEIHLGRANAFKVLLGALDEIKKSTEFQVIHLEGGSARNAIPRDAKMLIAFSSEKFQEVEASLKNYEKDAKEKYQKEDTGLFISLETSEETKEAFTASLQENILGLLKDLPHGVIAMSKDIPDLVETSSNLASVKEIEEGVLQVTTSQRSSVEDSLTNLLNEVKNAGEENQSKVIQEGRYPGWEPNVDSELLKKCKNAYEKRFGKEPVVEAIHAGLECGLIGAKYEGMDMISFGPTIENPHSPQEQAHIPSITNTWDFMEELMKSF